MSSLQKCDELKMELDELRPIEQKHIGQIRDFWQIGLAYSSNAIEGNTLTEIETKVILEDGITIGGKSVLEHMEAVGHKDALTYLFKVYKEGYSEKEILELHKLFYYRIDSSNAGSYRKENVIITGTDYEPPRSEEVGRLMENFELELSSELHPIEHASKAHQKLVNIHPFVDGNGRTARLLMNLILLREGFPIVSIPPIWRAKYIKAVSVGNWGDNSLFLKFMCDVTEQNLIDYLRLLRRLKGSP